MKIMASNCQVSTILWLITATDRTASCSPTINFPHKISACRQYTVPEDTVYTASQLISGCNLTPKSSPPCWQQISVRQELATESLDSKLYCQCSLEKVAAHELLISKHYVVQAYKECVKAGRMIHRNLNIEHG